MTEATKRCMVCAKPTTTLKGGICEVCEDKIRREALGEQARTGEGADRELTRQGITPTKK
jgi:hypothetical protein